ncbi:MAG: cobyrinate a,c-diamide synthase [Breznakibacter sp.]
MQQKSITAFLVAAPKSNSGKTLVTLGLIQALVNRGVKVQPFKCGPDYIDTQHHSHIAGLPSVNLDCWMAPEQHVSQLFAAKASISEVAIIEGAMGLFDGADKDFGSSAHMARILHTPIILVFDATAMAYGAAPLLWGLKNFDPSLTIGGVIFNKVSGPSQQHFLKQAAEDAGIRTLGFLPKDNRLALESRHLGLTLPHETPTTAAVNLMTELLEQHVDLDALLGLKQLVSESTEEPTAPKKQLKIAIARDEAFSFFYQANLDRLAELGEITFFSPLHDSHFPDCDLLWIPGGYPELHLEALESNQAMHHQIRRHAQQKKAIVAECGGMMYLGQSIIDQEGSQYTMTGLFDYETSVQQMKLHLGYREIICGTNRFRGHEFHHSRITGMNETPAPYSPTNARGAEVAMPIFRRDNTWASYLHLYLGEKEKMIQFLKQLNVL